MDDVARVRDTSDPLARVRLATEAVSAYQEAINELGQIRRDAVEELRSQGLTLTQIAERAGVSRARLSQLGTARPKPERALLSTGDSVTIAVPVEAAAYPQGDAGRPVIHREDAEFVERISQLAKSYGLSSTTEYVGPSDFIDMNREGLVVTCGPRQSPWLEQVLSADPNYGFEHDQHGWYLEDKVTGTRHRSPQDRDESGDYAYLGVLPRPDGQGGWLYAAGIHAAGSRGAALYLAENIKELYTEVRGALWSCLVRCEYEPDSRELLRADLVEPVKRRGRLKQRKTTR
ncbi:MAG: sigma-70 family RNA polymerase sigma factor [Streptosporangiales bacterium]|nr:sigma-70 family RNA polymerase sigma factor [Streptosporangiales bacterium]